MLFNSFFFLLNNLSEDCMASHQPPVGVTVCSVQQFIMLCSVTVKAARNPYMFTCLFGVKGCLQMHHLLSDNILNSLGATTTTKLWGWRPGRLDLAPGIRHLASGTRHPGTQAPRHPGTQSGASLSGVGYDGGLYVYLRTMHYEREREREREREKVSIFPERVGVPTHHMQHAPHQHSLLLPAAAMQPPGREKPICRVWWLAGKVIDKVVRLPTLSSSSAATSLLILYLFVYF